MVFDIDNTLVDTRHRTRAAARSFARLDPAGKGLAKLKLSRIGYDGRATARQAGLDERTTDAFHRYWLDFFWRAESFAHDRPIAQTTELVRLAASSGLEVYYLTGRVEALKEGTIAQLRALGLPSADASHVLCKPTVGVRTGAFKRRELKRLGLKRKIAFFMSDAISDLSAVDGRVACVWVDFPARPSLARPPAGLPTIRARPRRASR